jgi:hypothetical protein
VLGVRPLRDEVKLPVPVPFDVLVDKVTVGFGLVDQTTPLLVMENPPSEVIIPPEVADVVVRVDITVVVKLGMETIESVSLRQRTDTPSALVWLNFMLA